MNSLASSWFFENFQIPMLRFMGGAEWMPAGPAGAIVVIDVVGDGLLVGEGGVVGADRVVDPGALAGEDEAVVAGVVPGQHLGLHRVLVELLVPLDDLRGLVGVDGRRLAVGLEHLGAVAPRDRPVRRVGVARSG